MAEFKEVLNEEEVIDKVTVDEEVVEEKKGFKDILSNTKDVITQNKKKIIVGTVITVGVVATVMGVKKLMKQDISATDLDDYLPDNLEDVVSLEEIQPKVENIVE